MTDIEFNILIAVIILAIIAYVSIELYKIKKKNMTTDASVTFAEDMYVAYFNELTKLDRKSKHSTKFIIFLKKKFAITKDIGLLLYSNAMKLNKKHIAFILHLEVDHVRDDIVPKYVPDEIARSISLQSYQQVKDFEYALEELVYSKIRSAKKKDLIKQNILIFIKNHFRMTISTFNAMISIVKNVSTEEKMEEKAANNYSDIETIKDRIEKIKDKKQQIMFINQYTRIKEMRTNDTIDIETYTRMTNDLLSRVINYE